MLIQRDKFENSILEYDLIKRIIAILRFHQNDSKNNLTKHTAKCKVIQNNFSKQVQYRIDLQTI
jgi:hypothetical protein